MPGQPRIEFEEGGSGASLLVLLHGLGANARVWDALKPIVAERWAGRWMIPDFRGHGRSFHGGPYSVESHASDVAALLEGASDVTLVGHSMGGLVAIALASGAFGVLPRRVVAFCVKTAWTEDELARAHAVAHAPVKYFDTRAESIERYLRVSGLAGLIDADSPAALAGVTGHDGRFRLAADPLTNTLGTLRIEQIAASARAPVHLFCAALDRIADREGMKRLGAEVTELPGLGHNLHVEAPGTFWRAVERLLGAG